MDQTFKPININQVSLLPSIFQQRYDINRKYLLSLRTENLLQNHYSESGLWGPNYNQVGMGGSFDARDDIHWVGKHLPARYAANSWALALCCCPMLCYNRRTRVKGKADAIINELARCQYENGGEWVFSIPRNTSFGSPEASQPGRLTT